MTDAVRAVTAEPSYTFWDFKTFGWERKEGIRIDHLLLSPQMADRLEGVHIHAEVRGGERPSDHVPVEGSFAI
jgi:exodeoxyribonuclease-3